MSHLLRKLRRAPMFTAAAVVTLALGIGACSTIFSIVYGVLLRPLPYPDSERLVNIMHTAPGLGFDRVGQSASQHFTYRDENRTFTDVGMWEMARVSITGVVEPEEVEAALMTDAVLPLLGAGTAVGRGFTPVDDTPASPETVILAHGYWQRRFGSDPGVVGRSLRIDGRAREIIGVTTADFGFAEGEPSVYLPLRLDRSRVRTGAFRYRGIARLRPGVTLDAASADVARMIPMAFERFPGGLTLAMMQEARLGPDLRTLKDDVVGEVATALWVLLGTAGLVLLIAVANVTNLFLVRAEAGRRDLAIRTALGAGFGRNLRDHVAEGVGLGSAGAAVGLGLTYGAIRLLRLLAPQNLPRLDEIAADPLVVGVAVFIGVAAGALLGVLPLVQYGRPDLVGSLKEGARGTSVGRQRHRLRYALAAAEVSLAIVLLIGAGLMMRSFQTLRGVHPGFERPEEVLSLRLSLPAAEVPDLEQVALTHETIARRLAEIPGVTHVGTISTVPMTGFANDDVVFVEDFPTPEGQLPPLRRSQRVAGDYFTAMGIPLVAGRLIDWADVHERADVVLVSANFATEYWGTPAAALGKRIKEWHVGRSREIVGVVGTVRDDGLSQPAPATVYWPIATEEFLGADFHVPRALSYVIRAGRAPSSLLAEARTAVWSVNPNLPVANVETMDALVARSTAQTAFTLVMLAVATTMAILLGIVGVYGVMSYMVSQRTREIGVRVALGARPTDVTWMILRRGVAVSVTGAGVGLLAAAGITRLMTTLLFGVSPVDGITYAVAAVSITTVGLLASYLPSRRAASVEPNEVLRNE